MALAHLLRPYVPSRSVYAFIVDHGARPTSSSEASQVVARLEHFGFFPEILKLDWSAKGGLPASGFETAARHKRLQALGEACVQNGIRHLLFAHHADDLAETVLMRLLVVNANRSGLAGLIPLRRFPVDLPVYGGEQIQVLRPLLDIPKVYPTLWGFKTHIAVIGYEESLIYGPLTGLEPSYCNM